MIQSQKISLAELVDLYNSQQVQSNKLKKEQTLPLIFTHEQIKPALRNQSQIIKKIFTYENVSILIGYLKSENKDHAQLLKTIKFDPSGQEIPLCLQLPFMAMEILSCQCQIINDLLFQGIQDQNLPPLLPELLSFLDQPQHYLLASYFSRVICAITKRVSSASHKYNPYFSQWIFGSQNGQIEPTKSSLYKSINHLYSLTSIEYITKWLLISSKIKVKQEVDDEIFQKVIIQFWRNSKHQFLVYLIQKINSSSLSMEILNNVPSLFQQLLTQTEKNNKIATSLMIKSLPQIPTGPKITLYDLAVNQEIITQIFKSPQENCVNLAKIKLIKIYIHRYINQLAILQKNSQEDGDKQLKILQTLSNDQFFHTLQWMFQQLKKILNISNSNNSNETSSLFQQQQIEESRVKVTPNQKMIILHILQVLRLIHSLDNFRPQLVEYYDINSSDLARLIKRIMSLENNLIQLETSKLILSMLRVNKNKDKIDIPCDFARKLLTVAITHLIELNSAQCHVIEWADIILSLEQKHIFQNYEQEFEWDHIREIVENVKSINIGEYRLIQSNIDCFYSEEKALLKYSNFLNDFKVEVIYQQKKQLKDQTLSSKKTLPSSDFQQKVTLYPISIQPTLQFIESDKQKIIDNPFHNNYLAYDINDLIEQL